MFFFTIITFSFLNLIIIPFLYEFLLGFVCFIYLIFCIFISKQKINQNFNLIFSFFNFIKPFFIIVFFYGFIQLFYYNKIQILTFFDGYLLNNFSLLCLKNILILLSFFAFNQFLYFILKFFNFWKNFKIYPLLFMGSIFFLTILISTYNLFLTGLCIFSMSLCFYGILIGTYLIGHVSREPIVRYFVFSALSSGFFFGGIKEFFFSCETLNFNELNNSFLFIMLDNTDNLLNIFSIKYGLLLLVFSFLFKLSAAPTYFWAPDVYEGTSFAIITFLIIPTKFSISLIFIKIFKFIFVLPIASSSLNYILLIDLENFLLLIILSSIIIGGFNALIETKIKRFIAYSSINQIGFSLILFLGYNNSIFSIQTFLYFLIVYIINISIFLLIFCFFLYKINFLLNAFTIQFKNFNLNFLSDLNILFWFFIDFKIGFPILKKISFSFWLLLILVIFSFAGIPPLLGFFGKFYVILYLFKLKYFFILFICLFLNIISAFYYLRLLKNIFFDKKITNNNDEITLDFLQINQNFYYNFWYSLEISRIFKGFFFLNIKFLFLSIFLILAPFLDTFFLRIFNLFANFFILC